MATEITDTQNVEHATLQAPDISCAHCVQTVRTALGKLGGVSNVTASAETKLIDLDYDSGAISLSTIEAILDEAGYPVKR
ncbi:MAG: heavy-metal-associated domain-containing protein [Thermomicrobiales bacterium]